MRNLLFSEYSEWFGLGPLALAAVAGVRAWLAGDAYARWVWIAVAVLMVLLSVVYVIWARRTMRTRR